MIYPFFVDIKDGVYVNINFVQSIVLEKCLDKFHWILTLTNNEKISSPKFNTIEEAYEWIKDLKSYIEEYYPR